MEEDKAPETRAGQRESDMLPLIESDEVECQVPRVHPLKSDRFNQLL